MSDPTAHGPVDFVLLEFSGDRPTDGVVRELAAVVDTGTIRLYDLLIVRKHDDGSVTGLDLVDVEADGVGAFAVFAGARSGLLGDDDVAEAGAVLEPGTTAVLLVYENAWAAPFVATALEAGGELVASARIPATDVIAALDELDAVQPIT